MMMMMMTMAMGHPCLAYCPYPQLSQAPDLGGGSHLHRCSWFFFAACGPPAFSRCCIMHSDGGAQGIGTLRGCGHRAR
jgi:hypothetical protein